MDWQALEKSAVVVALEGKLPLFNTRTAEVGEMEETMERNTGGRGISDFRCRVLKPGGKWQTGHCKISVVFCPDELESTEPAEPTGQPNE
jgi:hypothetical protein